MVLIRFIKEVEGAKIGEIVESPKKSAQEYVNQGYAEYVKEEKIVENIFNPEVQVKVIEERDKNIKWSDYFEVLDDFRARGSKYKSLIIKKGQQITLACLKTIGESNNRNIREMIEKGFLKEIDASQIDNSLLMTTIGLPRQDKIDEYNKEQTKDLPIEKKIRTVWIDNYGENIEIFHEQQPFFYDRQDIFWLWDSEETKWKYVDEIDIMNKVEEALNIQYKTIAGGRKRNYIEALKRVGRTNHPEPSPKSCVQFKNTIYDYKQNISYPATPKYLFCNPIPYNIGESDETPIMDKLFEQWVGKKYVKTLYEIIAYCCIADYPIHTIFCFIGSGRNGKTSYQRIIQLFLGMENISSTELDNIIENRFETTKLYKKLACSLGETNFGIMRKTSLLKKLCSGNDLIGFEFKNKQPFDDFNYAKILISSNSIPTSEDLSDGFMRRWLIIDFPNEFPEGKDIIDTIPIKEYENLARKCLKIIPELIEKGAFTNQGTIDERRARYLLASNPFSLFIHSCCDKDINNWISYPELFSAYRKFLLANKRRVINWKEFSSAMDMEGLFATMTTKSILQTKRGTLNEDETIYIKGRFVDGIRLKSNWEEHITIDISKKFTSFTSITSHFQLQSRGNIEQVGKLDVKDVEDVKSQENIQETQIGEEILHHCVICKSTPCFEYDKFGKPLCKNCYESTILNK